MKHLHPLCAAMLVLCLAPQMAGAIELGQVPPKVELQENLGGRLDGTAWRSDELKGKVHVLFYVDPDEKDTNNEASEALDREKFPAEKFQSLAIINMAATWLVGDYMDDGKYGMKGWFGDNTKYNTYGITEANYRQGSTSSKSQFADFEKMPFQPIDNLGQYWYGKFQQSPTFQTLGFVLHTTDLLQPHHTWTTSALNHADWETWVNDNYYTQQLNADAKVTAALADFTPVATTTSSTAARKMRFVRDDRTRGIVFLTSADHERSLNRSAGIGNRHRPALTHFALVPDREGVRAGRHAGD